MTDSDVISIITMSFIGKSFRIVTLLSQMRCAVCHLRRVGTQSFLNYASLSFVVWTALFVISLAALLISQKRHK